MKRLLAAACAVLVLAVAPAQAEDDEAVFAQAFECRAAYLTATMPFPGFNKVGVERLEWEKIGRESVEKSLSANARFVFLTREEVLVTPCDRGDVVRTWTTTNKGALRALEGDWRAPVGVDRQPDMTAAIPVNVQPHNEIAFTHSTISRANTDGEPVTVDQFDFVWRVARYHSDDDLFFALVRYLADNLARAGITLKPWEIPTDFADTRNLRRPAFNIRPPARAALKEWWAEQGP